LWRAAPLLRATHADWTPAAPITMIVCGLAVSLVSLLAPARVLPVVVALAAAVALVTFSRSTLVPGRPEPVEVIAEAIRSNDPGPIVCACSAFARSLNFYTHVKTVITSTDEEVVRFLDVPQRVLAAVDAPTLGRAEASLGRRLPRLAEVTYVNTSVWPRALVDPAIAAPQQIFLVSNR
jgi:hypothetical protein